MGLKDIPLKVSYETEESNSYLLDEFYNPVLEQANKYYRIAGFFSSSSLVVAAKGIEGLIKNGGKMYLLISPELSVEDYETIRDHGMISENSDIFSNLKLDECPHENIQALAWLLDTGKLEIKIVVGKKARNSLFHQKVGILFDNDGNIVSFSGSINETAQAWINNVEEFKVFRSWETGQIEFLQSDLKKFLAYWKNNRKEIAEVYDVPLAIKQQIISKKPKDVWDLNIMRRYRKDKHTDTTDISLFPHQEKAVRAWLDHDCRLLIEMATGTGKTRTAIGCISEKLKEKKPLLVIVETPQITLSKQWSTEMDNLSVHFDFVVFADGGNAKKWKEMELLLLDLSDGRKRNGIIYTTHVTGSKNKFIDVVTKNKFDIKILAIFDEVHALGSLKQRNALLDIYDWRIGLSATPDRMFDESGTNLIRDYFSNNSYEFSIADALHTINPLTGRPFLNRYVYKPIFVSLYTDEERRYAAYSQKIAILKAQEDYDPDDLQKLYDRRADIGKNASGKIKAFESLVEQMGPSKIQDTLVFLSDKQIQEIFDILYQKGIKRAKITESESATKIVSPEGKTERQDILTKFKQHQLQIVAGIKCLDEGIDIPNARVAVLLSNSTNPREYVQRVGRVIRQAPDKPISVIYDFIVTPGNGVASGDGILEKEANRAVHIAKNAENFEDEVKVLFSKRGVVLNAD